MKEISIFSFSNFPNLFVDFIAKKDIKNYQKNNSFSKRFKSGENVVFI